MDCDRKRVKRWERFPRLNVCDLAWLRSRLRSRCTVVSLSACFWKDRSFLSICALNPAPGCPTVRVGCAPRFVRALPAHVLTHSSCKHAGVSSATAIASVGGAWW